MPTRLPSLAALALLALAGCLSGVPAAPSPTATGPPSPTASPAGTVTPAPPASGCARWVSFWGLDGPTTNWASDRVLIGYALTANASVFFVARENDTTLGVTHAETIGFDYGITADGDEVPLERSLSGTHTIRVTAHADANRNGAFDPGTDPPCRHEGAVVRTDARAIDFDRF